MATLNVNMPEQFSFEGSDWDNWLQRFQRFRLVSGLDKSDEEVQVSTLIYCMGPRGEDVFNSLNLSADNKKLYSKVVEKISNYFIPKTNVIFERARFHQRNQQGGEKVEAFITELHRLASKCNFGDFKEESIRDRIVVGILDKRLSERLQMDSNLTLTTVTEKVVQAEQVHSQQSVVQAQNSDVSSVEIKNKNTKPSHVNNSYNKKPNQNKNSRNTKACMRCGFSQHANQTCPALNADCKNCGKLGHYSRCCRSVGKNDRGNYNKGTKNEKFGAKSVGGLFLGNVNTSEDNEPWQVDLVLGGHYMITFILDSGADVSCIPETVYSTAMGKIKPVSLTARGAGGHSLPIVGKVTPKVRYGDKSLSTNFFIIRGLKRPLLGRNEIKQFQLLKRINAVSCDVDTNKKVWSKKYPKLFQGLGTLPGKYKLSLTSDAIPYSVAVPRRVAIPLLPKVKSALENMQCQGIIRPIEKPTDWTAPMVVVPKPNGEVRITTDFSQLNKFVRRKRFELPSVESTLARLGKASVFSKLDANSGFYQCVLDEESAPLTTFITPFGRFMYNRLPMGISSAPELFSRKMDSILSDLNGVLCLMDDVCIFGENKEEHDERLKKVLNRISEVGLTLNYDKCQFGVNSMKYLGFIVDSSGVRPDPDKVKAIKEYPTPKSITDIRRWMGMVNQLSKFIPNLSDKIKPLREFLCKNATWVWDVAQESAFSDLKEMLTS